MMMMKELLCIWNTSEIYVIINYQMQCKFKFTITNLDCKCKIVVFTVVGKNGELVEKVEPATICILN